MQCTMLYPVLSARMKEPCQGRPFIGKEGNYRVKMCTGWHRPLRRRLSRGDR